MDEELAISFGATRGYLNSATIGLPPLSSAHAFQQVIEDWIKGVIEPDTYDADVLRARSAFAQLSGVDTSSVAIGPAVSTFVGLVAASLPSGSEVVVAEGDFTSVLFPFFVQEQRGIKVREVPLDELAAAIVEPTALVALSAVQSSNGKVADLDRIIEAARAIGAQVLLDTTQACGWMPIDCSRVDYAVCGAYKWLLSPRGSAFMSIRPEHFEHVVSLWANWYGGEDIWSSVYGGPLRLSKSARRYDVSPAWFNWPSTAISLELLVQKGVRAIFDHNVGLANAFLGAMEMPLGNSAIVSLDVPGAEAALKEAGIRAAVRAGRVRLSFHLYNDMDDVELAVNALASARRA